LKSFGVKVLIESAKDQFVGLLWFCFFGSNGCDSWLGVV